MTNLRLIRTYLGSATLLATLLTAVSYTNHSIFNEARLRSGWAHLCEGKIDSLPYVGIWTISVLALVGISLISSRWMRLIWIVLVFLSATLTELSIATTGASFSDEIVEIFWNSRFSTDSFIVTHWQNIMHAAGRASLIPIMLAISSFLGVRKFRSSSKLLESLPLVSIFSLLVFLRWSGGAGTYLLPPQFSSIAVIMGWAINSEPTPKKEPVQISLSTPPEIAHVLLIIDESIRGDLLDINGAHAVTPFLKSITSELINFGLATSGSNCTATSNAFLRMGFNPRVASQSSDNLLTHPSLWQYAHRAGFTTVFIDNQRSIGQLQNYMNPEELALIDIFHQYPSSVSRMNRDHASVVEINKIQQMYPRTFIYLNKAGAHFHYEEAYPRTAERFKPHLERYEGAQSREKMINSYKNAVGWSVDEFFHKLLPTLDLKNTLVIYTSDHGQNLLDDGTDITHCRVRSPRQEEAIVPIFIITENPSLLERFIPAAALNRDRASHFQIFPTLLNIFGFEPNQVRDRYYLSLFERIEDPPGFTSAEIVKKFGSSKKWGSLLWHKVQLPQAQEPPKGNAINYIMRAKDL